MQFVRATVPATGREVGISLLYLHWGVSLDRISCKYIWPFYLISCEVVLTTAVLLIFFFRGTAETVVSIVIDLNRDQKQSC